MHPLFAGFKDVSPYALGAALGFAVHVEIGRGSLPSDLPAEVLQRLQAGGDLAGHLWAGGWEAPGRTHCLMFVKPLTALASVCWLAGLGGQWVDLRPSYFYTGAQVLGDLEAALYAAGGESTLGWPRVAPADTQLFAEAFALLLDGFMVQSGNDQLPLECLEVSA